MSAIIVTSVTTVDLSLEGTEKGDTEKGDRSNVGDNRDVDCNS